MTSVDSSQQPFGSSLIVCIFVRTWPRSRMDNPVLFVRSIENVSPIEVGRKSRPFCRQPSGNSAFDPRRRKFTLRRLFLHTCLIAEFKKNSQHARQTAFRYSVAGRSTGWHPASFQRSRLRGDRPGQERRYPRRNRRRGRTPNLFLSSASPSVSPLLSTSAVTVTGADWLMGGPRRKTALVPLIR